MMDGNVSKASNIRICNNHFTEDCFGVSVRGKTKLVPSAVPTLFEAPYLSSTDSAASNGSISNSVFSDTMSCKSKVGNESDSMFLNEVTGDAFFY